MSNKQQTSAAQKLHETVAVRVPKSTAVSIRAEAKRRKVKNSVIARERLGRAK